MVNNNKDYTFIIQDVIEYPPKVSVRIDSYDEEFLPDDKRDGYNIVNQMDAILAFADETTTVTSKRQIKE